MKAKRIAVLGSTGSIGRQTLEVISSVEGLSVCALAAGANWRLLVAQARELRPDWVALSDEQAAEAARPALPAGTTLLSGPEAAAELVRLSRPDLVLNGVVGSAGLAPTLAAIQCGADLGIANKETLVMAGQIVMPAARKAGVAVLPVDSEHSAIAQCLAAGRRGEVRKVVLTASGGALRDWDARQAADATVEQALNHPTWRMGPKITIDSATLVNKALEVVEAHWLFDLGPEEIEVVLHPESVIHSYVEYRDGSVIAQLAPPDMAMPIAWALCHPQRPARRGASLNLPELGQLTFAALSGRFARAVELGFEVIRRGGVAGAVLNGANEAAVEAFLAGRIPFGRIVPLVEQTLSRTDEIQVGEKPDLEALTGADAWARHQVTLEVSTPNPRVKIGAEKPIR